MPTPTSYGVSQTVKDRQLRERLIAVAAFNNIPNPEAWVDENRYALATAPINTTGDFVASKYEEALRVFKGGPGEDPAVLTDIQLNYAVSRIRNNPPAG